PNLLERALTHPSSTPHANSDNERMEFLGDSVVNLCVAQALYEWHPDWSEGDLTKVKSCVVSTQGLARAAELIGLRDVGRFGKGKSKKEAEQDAARRALEILELEAAQKAEHARKNGDTAKLAVEEDATHSL